MMTLPTLPARACTGKSEDNLTSDVTLPKSNTKSQRFTTLLDKHLAAQTHAHMHVRIPQKKDHSHDSLPEVTKQNVLLTERDKTDSFGVQWENTAKKKPEEDTMVTSDDERDIITLPSLMTKLAEFPYIKTKETPQNTLNSSKENGDGSSFPMNSVHPSFHSPLTPQSASQLNPSIDDSGLASPYFEPAENGIDHSISDADHVIQKGGSASQSSTAHLTAMVSSTSTIHQTSATNNVTSPLNTSFGSLEWQQAFRQQIVIFHRNRQQQAELRLDSQDLGAILIKMKLKDNQVQLDMVSNQSSVRAVLENAIPHLRSALAESGIDLGQSRVSSDNPLLSDQRDSQQSSHGNHNARQTHHDNSTTIDIHPATSCNVVDTFA